MLAKIFSVGLDLFAIATPISLAATNILFFPLAGLWLFGAHWTFPRWRPLWGLPEKLFLIFLGVSLLSALLGVDPGHSLHEIYKKDFYLLITVVMVALVRDPQKNTRLWRLFMGATLLMAVWGLIQFAVGVNLSDKTDGFIMNMPSFMAHQPKWIINLFALINGRVLGTRGHPISYAECLLFAWGFALCFLLSSPGKAWMRWFFYLVVMGGALLVSQSRGPWVAAGGLALVAAVTASSPRRWLILLLGILFVGVFTQVQGFRQRAGSILNRAHHSNSERLHMWQSGVVMWKTHPMLGVGPGNVKRLSPAFQTPEEKEFGAWGHLHSTYVNFLVERGVLGTLAFLLFIGAFVVELWRAALRATDAEERSLYVGGLLGILSFLVCGLTETAYNTAVVMMTFYFVLGLALSRSRHRL